jgi:hypothetical protein
LLGDGVSEPLERLEFALARPLDPRGQQVERVVERDPVDLAQVLLEQVGREQRLVGALDLAQPGLLAGREVLGVLPQREARALEVTRELALARLAGLVSDLAADLIERVGGELDDVEWVDATLGVGQPLGDRPGDPGGHVAGDQLDPLAALRAELIEEALDGLTVTAGAAHTSRPLTVRLRRRRRVWSICGQTGRLEIHDRRIKRCDSGRDGPAQAFSRWARPRSRARV